MFVLTQLSDIAEELGLLAYFSFFGHPDFVSFTCPYADLSIVG